MVVSSKSKANKNKAKDALPPRAVVADKVSAGEKSEYILRDFAPCQGGPAAGAWEEAFIYFLSPVTVHGAKIDLLA
jgi:hypothetical protein